MTGMPEGCVGRPCFDTAKNAKNETPGFTPFPVSSLIAEAHPVQTQRPQQQRHAQYAPRMHLARSRRTLRGVSHGDYGSAPLHSRPAFGGARGACGASSTGGVSAASTNKVPAMPNSAALSAVAAGMGVGRA